MSGAQGKTRGRVRPTVSAALPDGSLVETVYRPDESRTLFCVFRDGEVSYASELEADGRRLVPYSPHNNLLTHEVVLFPSEVADFGAQDALVAEIRSFIHRYVDVGPFFEQIAAYYVLLSWVYDAFSELPYLRLRGDPGTGKTRFLLIVGSLCYKPIFASGASTVSPLFRILDAVRGTLIIDEGDFRFSDEKAQIVKILNNGNARGFPVLRSEVVGREFNPTAFHVFGPKLVSTRGYFKDRALESRCITEEMGQRRLRKDIPINLPERYKEEALLLRNKLLSYRLQTLGQLGPAESLVDRTIEPRLSQVFVPLLSVVEDAAAREALRQLARRYDEDLVAERGTDMAAQVLEIIRDMLAAGRPLSIREITSWFADRYGEEYESKVTPKWIGGVVRRHLRLKTRRGGGGGYVIPPEEESKFERLYERYGIPLEEGPRSERSELSELSAEGGPPRLGDS